MPTIKLQFPILAAHYFGGEHPASFWDTFDESIVKQDFQTITSLGFNTIIFVVPWAGFHRDLNDKYLDEYHMKRLRFLIGVCNEINLRFALRVSYPWAMVNEKCTSIGIDRATKLFFDSQVRDSWGTYLSCINSLVEQEPNYLFSFYSWEDFPLDISYLTNLSKEESHSVSESSGYQRWFLDLPQGKSSSSSDQIQLPGKDSTDFSQLMRFIDFWRSDLLLSIARSRLKNLFYELRIDQDIVESPNGQSVISYDNRCHHPESLRCCYFAPYLRQNNVGKTISASDSVVALYETLTDVSGFGSNNNIFVDQFNFFSNEPDCGHLARI